MKNENQLDEKIFGNILNSNRLQVNIKPCNSANHKTNKYIISVIIDNND